MIPKIIHQTSNTETPEELRLRDRLCALLPGWEYKFWSDDDNQALVEAVLPQYQSTFRNIQRGVVKADIARYIYLLHFGGWYFDTDYRLVNQIQAEMLSHGCVLPVCRNEAGVVRLGNAVMGSEAQYLFWSDFLEHIFANPNLTETREGMIEDVTGPDALTRFYFAHKDKYRDVVTPERAVFHPEHRFHGFSYVKDPSTIGVHLSWSSWRSKNPLKAAFRFVRRKATSYSEVA